MKPLKISSWPPPRRPTEPPPRWHLGPPPRSRALRGLSLLVSLALASGMLGPGSATVRAQTAPPGPSLPGATASAEAPPPVPPPATAPAAAGPAAAGSTSLPGPRTTASRAGSTDPVRRRCKLAGVVLLSLAGVSVVGFFGSLIYNAVEHPEDLSLDPLPRLVFGLSTVSLGLAGSILLGYGLSTPPRPPLAPLPAPSAPLPPGVLPPVPEAPTPLGSLNTAALELRF